MYHQPHHLTPPNTKPPVAGAELTPSPTPTDYCAGGAMRSPDYDEICGTGEGEEEEKPLPEIGEDTSEDTTNDEDTGDDQPRFGDDQFFDDSDDSDNNGMITAIVKKIVTVKQTNHNHSLDEPNYLAFSDSGSKDDGSLEKFQKDLSILL